MKRSLLLYTLLVFFFACRPNDKDLPAPASSQLPVLMEKSSTQSIGLQQPLSRTEINSTIFQTMQNSKDFRWSNSSLDFIWSVAQQTRLVAIGYKPSGMEDISGVIHEINIQTPAWKAVHDALIERVLSLVNRDRTTPLTANEVIYEDDPVLPIIIFRINDKESITALYNLENIRYIEPYGYWPEQQRSTSGCGGSTYPLNTADYSTVTPNALLPWNFNNCNIPAAWSFAQGTNIRIGVIDAGISSTQPLLGSQFTSGESNVNRSITTDYTYGNSAFTSCTHGTSMCGLAAGPKNSVGGTTGVAYRSSLHFIRGCADVVLDESAELSGVRTALVRMGNLNNIRIISMSIGTPFYSGTLYDGVVYAHNKGKMLFAAAGTSFSWTSWWGVTYPAAHSQCLAITGVNESGSTCATCHDGSQVDFTIPMERNADSNRNSLTLSASGNAPSYIGGSSAATATAAGIAALVWSVKPSLSRTQVYNCLRNTSQFYPNISSSRGFGNLNAGAAVQMARTL